MAVSFDRRFLQKDHAGTCLGLNIPVAIIPWGSTFVEKLENTETLTPHIPHSWQQPGAHSGAGDTQYLHNPGKTSHCCSHPPGSPSPVLLGFFYKTRGHRGGHWGPCGYHRGSPGHQVEPKPCLAPQTLSAKGSFRTCRRNSVLLFCGFCPSGVLGLRRAQVLRAGKCPRENFPGSNKTWSFKTGWWKE